MKSTFYHEAETKSALAEFVQKAEVLSMGEECRKFEQEFARKQETSHAIMVNSGSSANLLVLQTLLNLGRLHPGSRVAFSALTWVTNVMPIIQLGLVPVPVDVELDTLNVSLEKLKGVEVEAFFITNTLGFCDDLPAIAEYCQQKGIILLEDNCEGLGSRVGGKLLGNFGVASTFSFYVSHHLSTIEGGMVVTKGDALRDWATMARAHGWDRNLAPDRQKQLRRQYEVDDFYARYTCYDLAYSIRPTEISGFLGNSQIKYWDEVVQKRAENFRRLSAVKNESILPLDVSHMDVVSNFAFPVVCRSVEEFRKMKERFTDVEIRPILSGDTTAQPFYKKYLPDSPPCPNARLIHNQGFFFANSPELTEEELQTLEGLLA